MTFHFNFFLNIEIKLRQLVLKMLVIRNIKTPKEDKIQQHLLFKTFHTQEFYIHAYMHAHVTINNTANRNKLYQTLILILKIFIPSCVEVVDAVIVEGVLGFDLAAKNVLSDLLPFIPLYVAHTNTDLALL